MVETELEKQLRFVKNAIYDKERGLAKVVTVGPGGWDLPQNQVGKALHSLITISVAVEKLIEENIKLQARIDALERKK
ncbi:hypothetical protein GF343_01485 [Candidatus Woesearchaeota archaeon]|nr:hypothetical protein [Candidatus Woesearchaeota archaeon]